MPLIASTRRSSLDLAYSGDIWWAQADWTLPERLKLPLGVTAVERRPSISVYEGRSYPVGGHDDNLVVDEHKRVNRQGILPPTEPPSVAVGAGAIEQNCYISFYDELTQERSPLSGVLNVTGDVNRVWTNLPARPPEEILVMPGTVTLGVNSSTITGTNTKLTMLRPGDKIALSGDSDRLAIVRTVTSDTSLTTDIQLIAGAAQTIVVVITTRVTHLELWVGVADTLPRLSVRRQIGVTSVTENIATLALGEILGDPLERFPPCSMSAIYHDRQVTAGDERNKDTVYLSVPFFPERFSGLSFKVRDGEPVTALFTNRDALIICTAESAYVFQGYTEDDFNLAKHDAGLGATSHHMVTDVYGDKWILNKLGIWVFNDAFHNISLDRLTEHHERYLENPDEYEAGFLAVNPMDRTVKVNVTTDPWVAFYPDVTQEMAGGFSQPKWGNDDFTYTEEAYIKNPGTGVGRMYYGASDSPNPGEYSIHADDPESASASIPNSGECRVIHKLYSFGDPGGDTEEGKTLTRLWVYIMSEKTEWTLKVYGGDHIIVPPEAVELDDNLEGAIRDTPDLLAETPASLTFEDTPSGPDTIRRYWTPKTVHHLVLERAVGRGITIEVRLGTGTVYSGLGGIYGPGLARRPFAVQILIEG